MEWYRAYHGMPYDPKLQVIAKRTSQPMAMVVAVWVCLLDAASQHASRGVIAIDHEEIAVIQGMELEAVEAIIQALRDKGMIDKNSRLASWDKRQHTTSTERSQKHRAGKKQDATPSNTAQRAETKASGTERKNQKKSSDTEQSRSETYSEAETDSKKESEQKENRARAEKREREREKQQIGGKDAEQSGSQILDQMLDIWNAEVQSKLTRGHKAILTPKRKEQMTRLWLENFHQDMRAWRYYCEVIGASDFCLGKLEGKGWTIDLSWAIESSEHVAKILEGGFSGGKHPAPPPVCHDPLLQTPWDHVLACFAGKYGKASCKSWLSGTEVVGIEPHPAGAFVVITCPNKFIQQWLEQHYRADLNLWWAEHSYQSRRITGVEFQIREAS
jgi:hypothetical protein